MKNYILENLSQNIRQAVTNLDFEPLQELRLRIGRPVMADYTQLPYTVTQSDIARTMELMSDSSIYAYLDEIKQGFITIRGGNRVGICGRVVIKDNEVSNIRDITGLNIRIARSVKGAADSVIERIKGKNTLIISPPQAGKSTMLRDIARQLGDTYKIGLVDERGEIAATYHGVPQHDVGVMTDVLDLCPKVQGMDMLLRSMSPDVIMTDEIATYEDICAIQRVINSGVKIIASAHGYDWEDVSRRIDIDKIPFEEVIVIDAKRRIAFATPYSKSNTALAV